MKKDILIDFAASEERENWEIINDSVMGGLSESRFEITEQGTALFQGEVSLENRGGFSSVRTLPRNFELNEYTGLTIRVKGDGKGYRLRVRTDNTYDGIAYQTEFRTGKEKWLEIAFPFDDFIPVFRGRLVKEAEALLPNRIRRIGIMIAGGQEGPFSLEIKKIGAYKHDHLFKDLIEDEDV